jgi:hypothetical protein
VNKNSQNIILYDIINFMSTILPYLINKTHNILLLKGDVGRSKPSVYELPENSFSYGKKVNRDGIGMKEITSDWQYSHNMS